MANLEKSFLPSFLASFHLSANIDHLLRTSPLAVSPVRAQKEGVRHGPRPRVAPNEHGSPA